MRRTPFGFMVDADWLAGRVRDQYQRQRAEMEAFNAHVRYVDDQQVVVDPAGFEMLETVPVAGFPQHPKDMYDGRVWKARTDYWWVLCEAVEEESDRIDLATYSISRRRLRVAHS